MVWCLKHSRAANRRLQLTKKGNVEKCRCQRLPQFLFISFAIILLLLVQVRSYLLVKDSHASLTVTQLDSELVMENNTFSFDAPPLPIWIEQYIAWHNESMKSLSADNWKDQKYIISRCLQSDRACGGASDRLKSLPTLLLLAAQSKRILLIHWNKPAQLQNFLVPARINWTVPDYVPVSGKGTKIYVKLATLVNAVDRNISMPVLCTRLQDQHGGSEFYNAHHLIKSEERAFRKVFRPLFFALFRPSRDVQNQVDREREATGLNAGTYAAAHLRAYYGNKVLEDSKAGQVAINAVNCASQMLPGSPILFLSDSSYAGNVVKTYGKNRFVVTMQREKEPLHLDKAESTLPSDYMDIFVDLLLFAEARCISHGQGGFGRFGVLLSRDPMCFKKYIDQGRYIECKGMT